MTTDTAARRAARGANTSVERDRQLFGVLLTCFFLSGFAALLYQTVWMRQFAIVFGTSELAIATVLAAYMAGLAIGAAIAGRWAHRLTRPVLAYGLLEFGVAAGALCVPFGMRLAQALLVAILGGQPEPPDAGGLAQPLFFAAAAFVVMSIPTVCMGATLPLLTGHVVHRSEQIGRRVGLLYAINTFGAVMGTLAAAFVLIPHCGLFLTTLFGATANAGVFALAFLLSRREADPEAEALPSPPDALPRRSLVEDFRRRVAWILPVMLLSGLVSFAYEVLWSRLLGQLIGGSLYAFATMLATFLTGITLGSAIAARLARNRTVSVWTFAFTQLGTAILSMITYQSLGMVPTLAESWGAGALGAAWVNAALCGVVLLPSTLCIGATFPLAVRILAEDEHEAAAASARVYAWNTIGGVAGAFLAGFFILPALEFDGTIRLATSLNLLLAVGALWLMPLSNRLPRNAVIATTVLAALVFQPEMPEAILKTSPIVGPDYRGEVVFQRVGRSSTVRLSNAGSYYLLQNNGLPEAVIIPKGTPPMGAGLHRWLTALPLLARPEARDVMVIGFGGGIAVEKLPDSVESIDVVELEPEVIAANRFLSDNRDDDPLSDTRLRVVLNDARGTLALTDKRYDVIVSQPSHPWTAGASHLYTREFLATAKEHLQEDGVFLQWMNIDFLNVDLFRSLGATLLSEFRYVRLYMPNRTALFFLGSDQPLELEAQLHASDVPLHGFVESVRPLGISGLNDVASSLVLDTEELAAICEGAPLTTDNRNRLAFGATPRAAEETVEAIRAVLAEHDALVHHRDRLFAGRGVPLNLAIIARRISYTDQWDRAQRISESIDDPAEAAVVRAIVAREAGNLAAAREHARAAVAANPLHAEAAWLLTDLYADELASGHADPELLRLASSMPDPQRALFEASLLLPRDDFVGLQRLEPRLAQVTPEHLGYPMSLYFRSAWRASSLPLINKPQLAEEALAMTDQALATLPKGFAYLIRFNAARLADRPDDVLGTVGEYARHLFDVAALQGTQEEIRRSTRIFTAALKWLRQDGRVPAERTQRTARLVDDLVRAAGTAEPPQPVVPAGYEVPGL